MGDFNTRIGRTFIWRIKNRFKEHLNDNGEMMIGFCTDNELRINISFHKHPEKYKYTFQNTRGQRSTIDYIVSNRNILPSQILDLRTLNCADIGSDHSLLLCKLRMRTKRNGNRKKTNESGQKTEKFNIESLWHQSPLPEEFITKNRTKPNNRWRWRNNARWK